MTPDSQRPDDDALARQYLVTLREGDPAAKAAARRGLARIFEARDLPAEAVELLLTNAREGHRDADLFRTLARLYRRLGDEALAAEAALESARYGNESPAQVLRSEGGSPATTAHLASAVAQVVHSELPPSVGPGAPAAPAPGPGRRPGRRVALRVAGWLAVLALAIVAAGSGPRAPLAAALYAIAAIAMGLLASGWQAGRRALRIPNGPLGTGLLGFVFALTAMMGGAVTPRFESPALSIPPTVVLPTSTPRLIATPVRTAIVTLAPAATPAPGPAAVLPAMAPTPVQPTAAAVPPPAIASPAILEAVPSPQAGLVVANAGAEGVRMRASPGSGDPLMVLHDGASVTALGDQREQDGHTWQAVRDSSGAEGWVAADYLARPGHEPAGVAAAPSPATASSPTSTQALGPGQAAPRGTACPPTHPIKGNIAASGERIYHVPSGAFYVRTDPEACFATEADARAGGFRRSLR